MTTGERLVFISTLLTGTAMDHFLNIDTGSGGGTVIRVFDKYTVKYLPMPVSLIRYVLSVKMAVKYITAESFTVKYIPTSESVIRYISSPKIKIIYQCKL